MNDSLVLVAMVVIGGLGSVSGAVIGAAWIIGSPPVLPEQPAGSPVHFEHRALGGAALLPRRLRTNWHLNPQCAHRAGRTQSRTTTSQKS